METKIKNTIKILFSELKKDIKQYRKFDPKSYWYAPYKQWANEKLYAIKILKGLVN